jgi:LPXTG-motif cell wall-anchored protein
MKGARALASGMLVLAAVCAVPAISAAQDAGTTTTTTTTTETQPVVPDSTSTAPAAPADGASEGSTPRTLPEPSDNGSASSGEVPAAAPSAAPSAASSPKARKSASTTVTMGDFFFSPASVSIAVGDTVTWRNNGDAPHNAVADDGSFSTQNLNKGESASHTFDQAGTFSYICTIHPQMKGTVRVLSSSSGGGGGNSAGSGTSGSGTSEASAVASPDAAGDSNTLPMTGMAAGALALVGVALLGSGLLMRRRCEGAPSEARSNPF